MAKTGKTSELGAGWWAKNLDEVDREIARLATACNCRILDPGVIERVLHNDESACGTNNPVAFRKLREAVMLHYHIRKKAVGVVGEQATEAILAEIVERLKSRIGDKLGGESRS